jgi:hypothetical protein
MMEVQRQEVGKGAVQIFQEVQLSSATLQHRLGLFSSAMQY